jgi:hypothetical protein
MDSMAGEVDWLMNDNISVVKMERIKVGVGAVHLPTLPNSDQPFGYKFALFSK